MSIYTQYNRKKEDIGRLLVKCPDKPGIVAALSTFLFEHGCDIMESSQYSSDDDSGMFYIRMEYFLEGLLNKRKQMEEDFKPLAEDFKMDYTFTYQDKRKRSLFSFRKKFTVY